MAAMFRVCVTDTLRLTKCCLTCVFNVSGVMVCHTPHHHTTPSNHCLLFRVKLNTVNDEYSEQDETCCPSEIRDWKREELTFMERTILKFHNCAHALMTHLSFCDEMNPQNYSLLYVSFLRT